MEASSEFVPPILPDPRGREWAASHGLHLPTPTAPRRTT